METENFSYEASIKEIKDIVNKLQQGTLDFDNNLQMYQRGAELIKACRQYLDAADLKIRQIMDPEDLNL